MTVDLVCAGAGRAARIRRVIGTALFTAAGLAGCAHGPEPALTGPVLSGRMSVQVAAADGQAARGFNASFDLRGTAVSGELRLSVPLGPQIAAARWGPGVSVLESSDGSRQFTSLADLARQALGEDMPLQALPDWLSGRPWPGAASKPLGASVADRPSSGFEQLGWQIDLTRHADGFVIATRSLAPAVTLRVRLDTP